MLPVNFLSVFLSVSLTTRSFVGDLSLSRQEKVSLVGLLAEEVE